MINSISRSILFLVFIFFLLANDACAQRLVTGRLIDKETEVPIANTEVRIVGKDVNTFSNKAGYFQLEIVDTDSLEIINSDYLTYIIAVPNVNNFRVSLIKSQAIEEDNEVNTLFDTPPHFPGGVDQFNKYLGLKLKFLFNERGKPITGSIYVKFVVEKDGKILHETIEVVKGLCKVCDENVIQFVKDFPDWVPARINGEPVSASVMLPIRFVLD